MLETNEVDVDFFTPASSSTLANIFKNPPRTDDVKDKTSLKYIPQQAPNEISKIVEPKPTLCVFACVSQVYEWNEGTYLQKGKLGFALVKVLKNDIHNFVIYDSNKSTISCATLSASFVVHVNENSSISYYDNTRKYWSIYAKDVEIKKVLELINALNIAVNHIPDPGHIKLPEVQKTINESKNEMEMKLKNEDETNDTDSSVDRRARNSILKRMAHMGQSVFPTNQTVIDSSDSSDSNELLNERKLTKPKLLKTNMVKTGEKNTGKVISIKKPLHIDSTKISDIPNPCTSLDIVKSSNKNVVDDSYVDIREASLLISEQKISNNELKKNITEISDKLDTVMSKLDSKLNDKELTALSYQNILVQKLLNEYETKIKNYEQYIKMNDLDRKNYRLDSGCGNSICNTASHTYDDKKDIEIALLKDEVSTLKQEYDDISLREKVHLDEINKLKLDMEQKNEHLANLTKKLEATSNNFQKSDDAKNKIKSIMNDTFQAIATNFTNDENFSGAKVKSIVAKVIKKTTIEAISEL